MGNEFKFAVTECTRCGQKLSGKHVELEGMKGPIPMGRCPKCGTAYPLEVEPSEKPPSEPTEPTATEPGEEPPAEE